MTKHLLTQRHLSHLSFCRKGFLINCIFISFFGLKIILFILYEPVLTKHEKIFNVCVLNRLLRFFSLYACLFCCIKQTDTDLINDSILPMCSSYSWVSKIKHILLFRRLRWLNWLELACGSGKCFTFIYSVQL